MAVAAPAKPVQNAEAPEENVLYDAVIIGSGMGGLVTATQLAAKGAKVLLLEKYIVPGGSAAYFEREGYTFDVGSSMMFGFGDQVSHCALLCLYAGQPPSKSVAGVNRLRRRIRVCKLSQGITILASTFAGMRLKPAPPWGHFKSD